MQSQKQANPHTEPFPEVQPLPEQQAIFHVIREIVRILEPALLLFSVVFYIALLVTFPIVSLAVMALTLGAAWRYRHRFPMKNQHKNSDYRLPFIDLLSEINEKGNHYQQPGR